MQILILEDNPERQKIFRGALSTHNYVAIVDTVKLAIALVESAERCDDQFDMIFIDHDLGGEVFVDSNQENTGYQFAKWLVENKIKSEFITHSLNPVGAKKIKEILPGCKHAPFNFLQGVLELIGKNRIFPYS